MYISDTSLGTGTLIQNLCKQIYIYIHTYKYIIYEYYDIVATLFACSIKYDTDYIFFILNLINSGLCYSRCRYS